MWLCISMGCALPLEINFAEDVWLCVASDGQTLLKECAVCRHGLCVASEKQTC